MMWTLIIDQQEILGVFQTVLIRIFFFVIKSNIGQCRGRNQGSKVKDTGVSGDEIWGLFADDFLYFGFED